VTSISAEKMNFVHQLRKTNVQLDTYDMT